MTELINVAELRTRAERDAASDEYDGYPDEVLALIEVVEAARGVCVLPVSAIRLSRMDRLTLALRRFDFGD